MTIFLDVDDVVRALANHVFGKDAPTWDYRDPITGKDFLETVNENPSLCYTAKPTKYLDVILEEMDKLVFLTCQLSTWKPYTEKWLDKYIQKDYVVIYVKSIEDKMRYLRNGNHLIDDYFGFRDYSKIALVDRPHNQKIKVPIRIRNPEELREAIRKWS